MTEIAMTRTPEAGGALLERSAAASSAGVLRVGLLGFGRTGRDVARTVLADVGASLEWVVRRSHPGREAARAVGDEAGDAARMLSALAIPADELMSTSPVDVIIDFSSESGLDYYASAAAARGVSIVSAVSRYPEVQQHRLAECARSTRVLWSPNITLGINVLMLAAQALQRVAPQADIQITEEHFRGKPEVSGTALRLARALGLGHESIHVTRAGGIIGVHEVLFGLPTQTVRLRHESISREAFGEGALFAAAELVGRPAGMYRMEDLLTPYFGRVLPPRAG